MAYSASDRALPSGAAGPRLPSDAVGALHPKHQTAPHIRSVTPPSVTLSCAARSVAVGALAPGAAESRAPFGRCGSPPSEASNRTSYSAARGTLPSGAAEPQAPFGHSESPSISRVSLLIQRRTGLPFRCSRPTAPFSFRCLSDTFTTVMLS